MHHLAIVHADALLNELSETEGMVSAAGFDAADPSEIPVDQLAFAVLVKVLAASAEECHQIIREVWAGSTLRPTQVDVLTTDSALMTRRHRRALPDMKPGDLRVHSFWIGYRRDDDEARRQAAAWITRTAMRRRWQLWR
jgi:hypothetical protein